MGYNDSEAQLLQEREGFETQLENQREHFLSELQNKEELLTQQQQDFEQKLLQTQRDSDQQLEQAENTIQELRQDLRQSKERCIEIQNISELVQQYEFVVPNFSRLKKEKINHTTPPMYSKPGGYKFIVEVSPAGTKTGAGSHVSVRVFTQSGEYDAQLTFPAKMNITLQLLNQENKREGHTKMIACMYKASAMGEFLGSDQQFISLAELDSKAAFYLKNDQMWFKVSEVIIETLGHK